MPKPTSWLSLALLSAIVSSTPIGVPQATELVFGTLGDSWASGVTYAAGGVTDYDNNKDGCMRLKDAYGPQVKDHHAPNQIPKFTFAACSGARMEDMVLGKQQLAQLDKRTTLVTMQAGGNDAGFYNIARDCIFHNEAKDYGSPYPDAGACSTTISNAEDYIMKGQSSKGFYFDMHQTIQDVLDQQKSKFDLYVIGYAHFFNVNSPDSDWCNEASFTVSWDEINPLNGKKRVPLSNELRSKINDLTSKLNNQIASVVASFKTDKVKLVDITDGFKGHRFCEPGSNEFTDRWGSDNVYFWNASPNGFFSIKDAKTQEADQEQKFNATYLSDSPVNNFNWVDLLKASSEVSGPFQGASPGIALRPFHPTTGGHTAIMKAINAARL